MDDDFNSALGLGSVFDAVRYINRLLDETPGAISDDIREKVLSVKAQILKIGTILGILTEDPDHYFRCKKNIGPGKSGPGPHDHRRSHQKKIPGPCIKKLGRG